jgi:hypothetical protein
MSLNRSMLVINVSYEPINVTSARRALTLLFKGAAVVEELSAHVVRFEDQYPNPKRRALAEIPQDAASEPGRIAQGDCASGC